MTEAQGDLMILLMCVLIFLRFETQFVHGILWTLNAARMSLVVSYCVCKAFVQHWKKEKPTKKSMERLRKIRQR